MNDRLAEEIKFAMNSKAMGAVSVREQFCTNTTKRRNDALMYRKSYKAANPGVKAYIAFPATVKVLAPNEEKYRVEKVF